jgi:hypothetical protein
MGKLVGAIGGWSDDDEEEGDEEDGDETDDMEGAKFGVQDDFVASFPLAFVLASGFVVVPSDPSIDANDFLFCLFPLIGLM